MDRRIAFTALAAVALVAALSVAGCDPKLTGTEDGDGTGGTDGPGETPLVTPEALIVGQVIDLHVEMMRKSLTLAAEYDSASAGLVGRALFSSDCITVAEQDAVLPQWTLDLTGCVDGNGTEFTGGGYLEPVTGEDAFIFLPWTDEDHIRATNTQDDNYNHTLDYLHAPGSIQFNFTRDLSGNVTAATASRFLKHLVRSDVVTFSFVAMDWSGAPGSFGDFPDAGSQSRVIWDGIGTLDVDYLAGGVARYTMLSVQYEVNLSSGAVSTVTQ
jgi:hypothetical protein